MYYIAFDLGGSGGKLFLSQYNGDKLELQEIHRFSNAPLSINGSLYWDVYKIYNEMTEGIKKAIRKTSDSILSMGIDSFSNDFCLISAQGEMLTPVRCYRDPRTAVTQTQIYNKMSPEELYVATGNQIALFSTFMQLAAMSELGQSYLLEKAHKLLFVPDLMLYFMSGKAITEYTMASVSQLYDYSLADWNPEIFKRYTFRPDLFAPITQPGTIIAATTSDYNAQIGSQNGFDLTAVCEHDTASAFLASVTVAPSAIISCGTWALVGTETDAPIINNKGFACNIANEGGYSGHHRLIRNVMGSWILQEIRNHYMNAGIEYTFPELAALAMEAPAFQYFIDVDDTRYFSPGDMPGKIFQACTEKYGHGPESLPALIRCVYDSLVMKYRWAIEKLELLTNQKFQTVNLVGGGSQDIFMCQLTANACGKPVLAGPIEATALGNIVVQLLAQGVLKTPDEGRKLIRSSFEIQEFQPDQHPLWSKAYMQYLALYLLT